MAKNIVVCLDGTNNKLRAAINTNVVRLFAMLDLSRPDQQVGYYDPGVGTFSSSAAWTPVARAVSRYAGLMFGAGLRQNLGEAYSYVMSVYEPGDRLFIFGFSRGAYTARALAGLLEVFGVFRRGSDNLIPYAVSAYAKQERSDQQQWLGVNAVAFSPQGRTLAIGNVDGTLGLWGGADPAHPRPLGHPLTSNNGSRVNAVAFSPDGHTLASANDDGTVRLWNLNVHYAIERICTTAGVHPPVAISRTLYSLG
jgi:Uncharacterized alpha/beta hydrolase domain (DUF2235)/WD domain, G-beta repeat